MAYEQRDNSGTLFVNDRKQADTHSDYNGTIMVDGKMYWINAWTKRGAKGEFFSLSVKPKEERSASPPRSMASKGRPADPISTGRPADLDDEVPFEMSWR